MPPKSRPQSESKQGLIITLVFFILASIILGVSTWFGFSEQEKHDKAAKEATDKLKIAETSRDWYRFQALKYRSVMGHPAKDADAAEFLNTKQESFDKDALKGGTDNEDVRTLIKDKLDKQFQWNAKEKKPEQTYEGMIASRDSEIETIKKQNQELEKKVKEAKKALDRKAEELADAQKNYDSKIAELAKTNKEEFDKSQQDLASLRADMEKFSEDLKKERTKVEDEKKTLTAQIEKLTGERKHLLERVKDKEDRLASLQAKSNEAPASMRSDWKISQMDTRGTNPYINLGSADKVKPQLTFTIHGVGVDGRPNPQPKGTLEVVNVINDHLSQTRITSVKDRDRDPILEGDVIYNPSWNPNIKKHVAVAGIIDLTGDGRDNLKEFLRNLENQNVVVDAYVDPKDGSIKGKITFRTDFLILGDVPDPAGRGKLGKVEENILNSRKILQDEAKKYGVPSQGLMRYLEMIGYRLPHATREQPARMYQQGLRPERATQTPNR